jgi:hypothetical protein
MRCYGLLFFRLVSTPLRLRWRATATIGTMLCVARLRKRRTRTRCPSADISKETELEIYRQAANDARAYMDMRNRHFSTFLIISGILLAGLFQVAGLMPRHTLIAVLGLTVTILYWMLDYRMAQYLRGSTSLVRVYEAKFHKPSHNTTPGRRLLPATLISNLLFAMIFTLWMCLIFLQHEIFRSVHH